MSKKAPAGSLSTPNWNLPHQPLYPEFDAETLVRNAYLRNLYVYRAVNYIANNISSLPFRAGTGNKGDTFRESHPLARLLGPAPGSPNPMWAPAMMWRYAIAQYLVMGKTAWAPEWSGNRLVGLWPLAAQHVRPILCDPTSTKPHYFEGYEYGVVGSSTYRKYKTHELIYLWRPSLTDPRQPESIVSVAGPEINIAWLISQFDTAFLQNGAVPSHLVVTDTFATDEERNGFRGQFVRNFGGAANAGRPMFAEREIEQGEAGGNLDPVQVIKVGQSQIDSQLDELRDSKISDITVALGVPLSLLGESRVQKYCADTETEVLTRRGWLTYDQLQVGDSALTLNTDTETAEWQPVSAVNVFPGPAEVVRIETSGHSSVTTLDHRWPTRAPWRQYNPLTTEQRRWTTTDKLHSGDRLYGIAPVSDLPQEAKYTDAFVELAAWTYTEGHFSRGTLVIGQSLRVNPQKCARIRAALMALLGPPTPYRGPGYYGPVTWTERPQSGEMTRFYLSATSAEQLASVLVDTVEKVPATEFITSLTQSQLDLFIDVSIQGDGTVVNSGTQVFAQKSRGRAEALQLAALLSGRSASIKQNTKGWTCSIWQGTMRTPLSRGEKILDVVDTVWCPTTPNATWLARRGGHAYFTGNSNMAEDRKNAWSETIRPIFGELEDLVNTHVSPLFGSDTVAWFDTKMINELRPTPRYADADVPKLVQSGLIDEDEYRADRGLPPLTAAQRAALAARPAPPVDPGANTPSTGADVIHSTNDPAKQLTPPKPRKKDVPNPAKAHLAVARALADHLVAEMTTAIEKRASGRRRDRPAFDAPYWTRRAAAVLTPPLEAAELDEVNIRALVAGLVFAMVALADGGGTDTSVRSYVASIIEHAHDTVPARHVEETLIGIATGTVGRDQALTMIQGGTNAP